MDDEGRGPVIELGDDRHDLDGAGVAPPRRRPPGRLAVAALALLVGLGAGVAVGQRAADTGPADLEDLRAALALATGVPVEDVRGLEGYAERDIDDAPNGVRYRQVVGRVPLDDGRALADRLWAAGYRLRPEQMPECVSDMPALTGVICTYHRGRLAVAVQMHDLPGRPGLDVMAVSD